MTEIKAGEEGRGRGGGYGGRRTEKRWCRREGPREGGTVEVGECWPSRNRTLGSSRSTTQDQGW